jgi:hypothetical protein
MSAKTNKTANNETEIVNDATTETGLQVSQQNDSQDLAHNGPEVYGVELTADVAEATMAALAMLPSMNRGIEVTAEYYKFTAEGEQIRGIYAGQQRITPTKGGTTTATNSRVGTDGKIAAAKLMIEGENGGKPKMIICADAVIVSTLESFRPATPVAITFKGEKTGKNGTYKQYSIEQLFAAR